MSQFEMLPGPHPLASMLSCQRWRGADTLGGVPNARPSVAGDERPKGQTPDQ